MSQNHLSLIRTTGSIPLCQHSCRFNHSAAHALVCFIQTASNARDGQAVQECAYGNEDDRFALGNRSTTSIGRFQEDRTFAIELPKSSTVFQCSQRLLFDFLNCFLSRGLLNRPDKLLLAFENTDVMPFFCLDQ